MMTAPMIAAWSAGIMLVVLNIWSSARYVRRRERRRVVQPIAADGGTSAPPVTIIVIVHRLSENEVTTGARCGQYSGQGHQLLICSDRADDPAVGVLTKDMPPSLVEQSLVIVPGPYSANPKADMMASALARASHDRVICLDGNANPSEDLVSRVTRAAKDRVTLVSTLPSVPQDDRFWTLVETSLQHRYNARWLYMSDLFGKAFAMGKLLSFSRSWLEANGGSDRLYDCVGEDTSLTLLTRRSGGQVALVDPDMDMSIAPPALTDIFFRAKRWAVLRKNDTLPTFLIEPLGTAPVLCGAWWAVCEITWGAGVVGAAGAYGLWHLIEAWMAHADDRRWSIKLHAAAVIRDGILLFSWVGAIVRPTYKWRMDVND